MDPLVLKRERQTKGVAQHTVTGAVDRDTHSLKLRTGIIARQKEVERTKRLILTVGLQHSVVDKVKLKRKYLGAIFSLALILVPYDKAENDAQTQRNRQKQTPVEVNPSP